LLVWTGHKMHDTAARQNKQRQSDVRSQITSGSRSSESSDVILLES